VASAAADPAANVAAGSAEGLNAAANLWFVSPPHSYDAALAQRHGAAARAAAYYALGEAPRPRRGAAAGARAARALLRRDAPAVGDFKLLVHDERNLAVG